ncbi:MULTISPECIES: rhomboid family intramembrane serine protease [unclassified Myroides]|uniref:rhomboid family intramembrane serine protease n=1 Tax=unclassified Myroides TaxID=2642485 RepID=UPI0015FDAC6C|nr:MULTISPECIES: rhomboid family intramembrane serine protease [unclassified Myroides]MBB1149426.1 rhomboid family intramembrane serine protease [Myroides sp. NP-2]MDM1406670.1 rhomboid family intramembrane serine protease [Myroides sp. DF42-4-2]
MDIAPIILVILVATGLVTYKGLQDYSFFSKYNFDLDRIRKGELYRLITSGFLHVDWMHFAFNMFTLYMFAGIVVAISGSFYFILIYMLSIAIGNILTYQLYQKRTQYYAVGASGGVTGVVYASILLYPDLKLYLFFIPIGIKGYIFAIAYLLYSLYGMKKNSDNIGHAAHFGGAIGGLVLTLVRYPMLLQQQAFLIFLLLIPIALLLLMVRTNKL